MKSVPASFEIVTGHDLGLQIRRTPVPGGWLLVCGNHPSFAAMQYSPTGVPASAMIHPGTAVFLPDPDHEWLAEPVTSPETTEDEGDVIQRRAESFVINVASKGRCSICSKPALVMSVYYDHDGNFYCEDHRHLALLGFALEFSHLVLVTYEQHDDKRSWERSREDSVSSVRAVRPIKVVLKGPTYLLQGINLSGAFRNYSLSKITDLTVLPDRFEKSSRDD